MDLFRQKAGQQYSVLGLNISDPEMMRHTTSVILSCGILCIIAILTCIVEITQALRYSSYSGALTNSILGLISSLGAPAFGYMGVIKGSASFMCMFVALMMVNCAISVTFIIALLTVIQTPTKYIEWSYLFLSYLALILFSGAVSLFAAYHGNILFRKLFQGEQILEGDKKDTELGSDVGKKRVFTDFDEESFDPLAHRKE